MTDVRLTADEHFESLREPVWRRLRARHGAALSRDRFEEVYSEWWARELERAAAGRPSRAAAPAAFVSESVQRLLIDEARARARGLARDEKASLAVADIDDHQGVAGAADTAGQARYEAIVHRLLALVSDRLSDRERRVFIWTYLYLRSTEVTAASLGLSPPRVKKDRKRIAAKVGEEVWAVLSGELQLCPAYDDKRLQAVFELMTDHVEDCPRCRESLGGVRAGALAVLGPVELLAAGDTGPVAEALDGLLARLWGLVHRATETAASMPAGGRAAAVIAAGATAVAGGSVAVTASLSSDQPRARAAPKVSVAAPQPTALPAVRSPASPRRRERPAPRPDPARERFGPATAGAGRRSPPRPARPEARASPPPATRSAPGPPGEFGFERH